MSCQLGKFKLSKNIHNIGKFIIKKSTYILWKRHGFVSELKYQKFTADIFLWEKSWFITDYDHSLGAHKPLVLSVNCPRTSNS